MKRSVLFGLIFVFILFSFAGVFAEPCNLEVSMINQDPYPAIQGEEVKVVFQIQGLENTECGTVEFELLDNYPLTLMPNQKRNYIIESGTFQRDYESFFLASFNLKVSPDALDGDNPIEVKYKHEKNIVYETEEFNVNVEDTRADFEVFVKDYDATTKTITFEILNIAESDISALTIEVPKQDSIEIKGANRNIEGDLDSNDYVTTDFEGTPREGDISLNIYYTDSINERRIVEKMVHYDPTYFEGRLADEPKDMTTSYVVIGVVVLLVVYFIYRRIKKKKKH